MTYNELKRLKRLELLEIMIAQDKEMEALRRRLEETEKRLSTSEQLDHRYLLAHADDKGES